MIQWFFTTTTKKCGLNFPLPQNPECFDHPCHYKYRVLPSPLSTGIFYYYQTRKTTNIRNTSGMFLCCKEKANWAQKSKLRVLVVYDCGFIVCLCVLISDVLLHSTINMLEIFQVLTINLVFKENIEINGIISWVEFYSVCYSLVSLKYHQ